MHRNARNILALGAAAIAAATCVERSGSDNGPLIGRMRNLTLNQDTTAIVPVSATDRKSTISSLAPTTAVPETSQDLPRGSDQQTNDGAPTEEVSFTALAEGVLAKPENDEPAQVGGYTLLQDADTSPVFDAVIASGS